MTELLIGIDYESNESEEENQERLALEEWGN